jgi:hypothetical protein
MSEGNDGGESPKRAVLLWSEVDSLTAGIDRYEKTSFWVIGTRGGTRIAVPKTAAGVSRAYFYGTYEQVPELPGVRKFSSEERKRRHLGGIIAEVDFDVGPALASAALAALAEQVRLAPAPPPRGERKPRQPRIPKAAAGTPLDSGGDQAALASDDGE